MGLYIHIPFCKSRCIYCDFFSTTRNADMDAYADALCREIGERCKGLHPETVYVGGGTPSWLGVERLEEIFRCLQSTIGTRYTENIRETTIECNTDDVTEHFVACLKRLPVNRVSLGVQSFTDERLHLIGRRHSASQAIAAVRRLQDAGYSNISIDLIYGLPGQSMDEWRRDLAAGLALGTPHLSAYSLMYEEGTPLWSMREQHRVTEAHEELSIAMYQHLIDACAEAGLVQYELSNFARPGYKSQHNCSYWEGKAYTGVGAGAHEYDGAATRRMNIGDLDRYIAYWKHNEGEEPVEKEHLNDEELFDERVFTALRTRRGLDWGALERDFPTLSARIKKVADRHLAAGNLVWDNGRLRLTRQALFVSDDVVSDLMCV